MRGWGGGGGEGLTTDHTENCLLPENIQNTHTYTCKAVMSTSIDFDEGKAGTHNPRFEAKNSSPSAK